MKNKHLFLFVYAHKRSNTIFKSTEKFRPHKGYIFLFAEYIAKLLICHIHLLVRIFTVRRDNCKRLRQKFIDRITEVQAVFRQILSDFP